MRLFRDATSFGAPVWVWVDGPYMVMSESLLGLVRHLVLHWHDERDLVG